MSQLSIPTLGDTVGGSAAANDSDDVKIVQGLLNAAVLFGESSVNGFGALAVNGKVTDTMLRMIQQYQRFKGLGAPPKFQDVLIEPGKGTMKNLAENPYVDARWSEWDAAIKTEVTAYNKKFGSVAGWVALDWRLIKAQVWTEVLGGPDVADWTTRPMQIGKFASDTGLRVIKGGLDHSELITDKSLRDAVAKDSKGANNIRAGVAYDVHCNAKYKFVEVIDDPAVKVHTLGSGEALAKVAADEGTTVANLMSQNGLTEDSAKKLHPGDKLKFQKAHNEWQIIGWKGWDDALKAYNGGGDPQYMTKIADKLTKISRKW
jgi:LysM repeat protein